MRKFNTFKPVNIDHPMDRQNLDFIDKWSLFGGYLVLFIKEGLKKFSLN